MTLNEISLRTGVPKSYLMDALKLPSDIDVRAPVRDWIHNCGLTIHMRTCARRCSSIGAPVGRKDSAERSLLELPQFSRLVIPQRCLDRAVGSLEYSDAGR